jgi:hypothetical protein
MTPPIEGIPCELRDLHEGESCIKRDIDGKLFK